MFFAELSERLRARPDLRVGYLDRGKPAYRSFPEVDADVDSAAAELAACGVGAGSRVGLLGANSYAWVVADLALLRLGATSIAFPEQAGVPLDELVAAYDPDLLLASRAAAPADAGGVPVAVLGEPLPQDVRARPPRTAADGVPSITFSTGSSGTLKSLDVSEEGSRHAVRRFCARFSVGEGDLFLIFLPLSSYQQRVMVYGCIILGIDMAVVEPAALFRALASFRPTLLLGPPLLFHTIHDNYLARVAQLRPAARTAAAALRRVAWVAPPLLRRALQRKLFGPVHDLFGGRIRLLWTGMAPIRPQTLAFFVDAGLALYEAYGLNETGPVAANAPGATRRGSVGRPLVEGSVSISPTGEIMVALDPPVTTGYRRATPEEQASTYLPDGRIATGDLGRMDADGFLYLTGRMREVIVTREGHKVSPEVLERALGGCPGVRQAVVFGNGLPALAAVVSLAQDSEAARAEVRRTVERINRTHPPALALARLVFTTVEMNVESGLLTRNLKLDRRAIFERFRAGLAPGGPSAAAVPERGGAGAGVGAGA